MVGRVTRNTPMFFVGLTRDLATLSAAYYLLTILPGPHLYNHLFCVSVQFCVFVKVRGNVAHPLCIEAF